MNGNDIPAFRPKLTDLGLAFGLLTRVPLPRAVFPAESARPAAHAAWAYPLVGVLVGGIAVVTALIALQLGLPLAAAALLAILASVLVTGALHEDGLADCADGFWGGWTAERRLEIMKDSQFGSYGVIALVIGIGLKASAIFALIGTGYWAEVMFSAAILSRSWMVAGMHLLPNARAGGLSRQTGHPPVPATLLALGIGAAVLLISLPVVGMILLVFSAAMTGIVALIARAKIGGQTGDVLGATQQLVEITVLLTATALLT